jgi:hypothetical protein
MCTVPSTAESRAEYRRHHATVKIYASTAEHAQDDAAFWLTIPPAERVLEVWRLSEELWRLRGDFPDEPGLCRSVASVRRR